MRGVNNFSQKRMIEIPMENHIMSGTSPGEGGIYIYTTLQKCDITFIAQIGPLSFQAAIEHKPIQVRWGGLRAPVVTEWWPACLHKQFPSVHHTGN